MAGEILVPVYPPLYEIYLIIGIITSIVGGIVIMFFYFFKIMRKNTRNLEKLKKSISTLREQQLEFVKFMNSVSSEIKRMGIFTTRFILSQMMEDAFKEKDPYIVREKVKALRNFVRYSKERGFWDEELSRTFLEFCEVMRMRWERRDKEVAYYLSTIRE